MQRSLEVGAPCSCSVRSNTCCWCSSLCMVMSAGHGRRIVRLESPPHSPPPPLPPRNPGQSPSQADVAPPRSGPQLTVDPVRHQAGQRTGNSPVPPPPGRFDTSRSQPGLASNRSLRRVDHVPRTPPSEAAAPAILPRAVPTGLTPSRSLRRADHVPRTPPSEAAAPAILPRAVPTGLTPSRSLRRVGHVPRIPPSETAAPAILPRAVPTALTPSRSFHRADHVPRAAPSEAAAPVTLPRDVPTGLTPSRSFHRADHVPRTAPETADPATLPRAVPTGLMRRRLMAAGCHKFNSTPAAGISYLMQHGLLRGDPDQVARLLHSCTELDAAAIGQYLSHSRDFSRDVLAEYVRQLRPAGLLLVPALRILLSRLQLPGDREGAIRILRCFF